MATGSGLYATAGSKIYIGSVLAAKTTDFVLSDFNSQSWCAINWMENLGQIGDEASEITFSPIDVQRVMKLKGVFNAGNMALVMGADYTDEGQTLLRAAEKTIYDYAFKILFNDKPSGGTSGSIRMFVAKVMAAREQLDTVNNVLRLNATLGINSNIVQVNAY